MLVVTGLVIGPVNQSLSECVCVCVSALNSEELNCTHLSVVNSG